MFGGIGGASLGRVMMFQEGTQVAGIPYGSYDFVVSGTIGSTSQGRLRFANSGTAAFPMITGLNDTNTGIYFPSADTVSISTNGVERLKITGSGDMTIAAVSGTTAQFTTVSASNFFPIDNAVKYPLVLNTGETGLPGWEILGLNTDGGASTISTSGSNLVPFWFSEPISVKSVSFVISSGSTGPGLMDVSIWGCQRSTGSAGFIPVTRVYNTSSIDVSTIGSRTITSGFPLTLEPGLYSVVLTTNNQVNSRSFVFNAPGARMARFTVSGPQVAVIQKYFANTGYPASTTWTAPVDLSVAYGAIGYRAEAAIDWTSSSL